MIDLKKIRTIIVDDELQARKYITVLLEKENDLEIIGECKNGNEAVDLISKHEVDLVFLDIQMPGLDGFGVISSLPPDKLPLIIFITAYDKYILDALKIHAFDYLLKPFSEQEFHNSINNAKEMIYHKKVNTMNQHVIDMIRNNINLPEFSDIKPIEETGSNGYLKRIPVSNNKQVLFIDINDIYSIEAYDNYIKTSTKDKSHLLRETMNNMESKLNPDIFVRVHRSAIVNIEYIKMVEPFQKGNYILTLNNGQKFKITKSRKNKLKKVIGVSF
jgi:two-component system, LytTR family, response regulator